MTLSVMARQTGRANDIRRSVAALCGRLDHQAPEQAALAIDVSEHAHWVAERLHHLDKRLRARFRTRGMAVSSGEVISSRPGNGAVSLWNLHH